MVDAGELLPAAPEGLRRPYILESYNNYIPSTQTLGIARLEAMGGDRVGQHSIRVNDQWRICFRWQDGDAHDVEMVDYH